LKKYSGVDHQKGQTLSAFSALLSNFKQKFQTQDLAQTIRELIESLNFKGYIEKSYEQRNTIVLGILKITLKSFFTNSSSWSV